MPCFPSRLTLKNFHYNPNDLDDLNVFCVSHKPRDRATCDATSVSIKNALNVPKLDKVNEQIRGEKSPSDVFALRTVSASSYYNVQTEAYYGMGQKMSQPLDDTDGLNTMVGLPNQQTTQLEGTGVHIDQLADGVSRVVIQSGQEELDVPAPVSAEAPSLSRMTSQSDDVFPLTDPVVAPDDLEKEVAEDAQQPPPSTVNGVGISSSSPMSSISSTSSLSTNSSRLDRPSAQSLTQEMLQDTETSDSIAQTPQTIVNAHPIDGAPAVSATTSARPSSRPPTPVHFRIPSGTSEGSPRSSTSSRGSYLIDPEPDTEPVSTPPLPPPQVSTAFTRADRPSSSGSYEHVRVKPAQRMLVKSQSSNDVISRPPVDMSRQLSRNESMRADRPSQNS
ncbi:uncharacterized protein LOC101848047 [Aplysia californica]|uniref:Uncharacterized protein LOC101848047 n=1 Tax=Aplysia californica TaxID=6500 RepID=A0ABM1A130_APLCA|nr:uncharacterized protein LOC101848047 [Aplysia californica]